MGWADIAGPGTDLTSPSVAEYWNPASGSDPGTDHRHRGGAAKGMKVVMAPANHTYLDQKYLSGSAGNVPPTLGQNWACNTGCDVDQFYNWDPGSYVTGVTDRNVIGVEGAMWGETVRQPQPGRLHGVPAAARTGRARLVPEGGPQLRQQPRLPGLHRAGSAAQGGRFLRRRA